MQRFIQRTEKGFTRIRPHELRRGFTLIELIIVIAIIAIVVSAVFVAIDPVRRINDARNARSSSDAENIDKAIQLYMADGNPIPASAFELGVPTDDEVEICPSDGNPTGYCESNPLTNTFDPDFLVDAGYLPALKPAPGIPTTSEVSGYKVTYSGGAYTGVSAPTFVAGASSSSTAVVQQGIILNGSSTVVSIDDDVAAPFSVEKNQPFSVSFWINPTLATSIRPIISKLSSGPITGYTIRLTIGAIQFMFTDGTTTNTFSSDAAVVPVMGAYYHVLVTYDGSNTNDAARIYVNGADVSRPIAAFTPLAGNIKNTQPLLFGLNAISYAGTLDDVRFYSTALSQSDARLLSDTNTANDPSPAVRWSFDDATTTTVPSAPSQYAGTLTNGTIDTVNTAPATVDKSLVGYWRLNEVSGTQITNYGTIANTGTLNGSVTFGTDATKFASPRSPNTISFGPSTYMSFASPITIPDALTFTTWWYGQTYVPPDDTRELLVNTDGMGLYIYDPSITGAGHLFFYDNRTDEYFHVTNSSGTAFVPVTQNAWNHIAMTVSSTGLLKIYLNGVTQYIIKGDLPGTATNLGIPLTSPLSNVSFDKIGFAGSEANGIFKQTRLYTRELTSSPISVFNSQSY